MARVLVVAGDPEVAGGVRDAGDVVGGSPERGEFDAIERREVARQEFALDHRGELELFVHAHDFVLQTALKARGQ